jgi:hypothetical protein
MWGRECQSGESMIPFFFVSPRLKIFSDWPPGKAIINKAACRCFLFAEKKKIPSSETQNT